MEPKVAVKKEPEWLTTVEELRAKDSMLETETIFVKTEPLQEDEHLVQLELPVIQDEAGPATDEGETRTEHQGPYTCELCSAIFDRLHDIAEHIESYCGKRPYKCKQCGRRVSDLSTHKHVRSPVKEPLFSCDICQRMFLHLGTLTRHKRSHVKKPHKCEFCWRTFAKRSGLICHLRSYKDLQHQH